MSCSMNASSLGLYGLPSENESGGLSCSTTDEDDADSLCSMFMSTSDSGSEIGIDDETSDAEDDCLQVSPFTPDQTLLIFDWDDTILPSTWIQRQGLRLDSASIVNPEQQKELTAMAQCATRTLKAAKRYGTVVLVTNAEQGWIELSSKKFMPSLCPLLESVKISSARAAYEKPGVTLPSMWKSFAFRDEINNFYNSFGTDWSKNVISFGDAMYERQAVFEVTSRMPNCCTKSFKFMEQPNLEQLQREHELIYWCLRHIVSHNGTLDLQVQLA